MNKTFKIDGNDISDGYHTFGELYDHRVILYLTLCLQDPMRCRFKRDYEGWFCLYLETSEGQISYHLPNKYIEVVQSWQIKEDPNYKWDGHTSKDVVYRLEKLARKLIK